MRNNINKIVSSLANNSDNRLYCFVEDALASMLLYERTGINWLSVTSESDKRFLSKFEEGKVFELVSEYKTISQQDINDVVKKVKTVNPKDAIDITAYNGLRMNVAKKRQKLALTNFLDKNTTKYIVMFDANNNFVSNVNTYFGDGKFILNVNVYNGVKGLTVGGVILSGNDLADQIFGMEG